MRKREDLKFFASIHKRSSAVLAELLGGVGGGRFMSLVHSEN